MKTLIFILFAAILIGGLIQNGYSQPAPIKLNYALFQPATAALSKVQTEFAQEIEKRTNGRVQIQVFQSGSLLAAPASSIYILPKDEMDRWTAAIMPVIDARLKELTTKGFSRQEVEDAFAYFKSRVEYWNGQQAKSNVTPLLVRLEKVIK